MQHVQLFCYIFHTNTNDGKNVTLYTCAELSPERLHTIADHASNHRQTHQPARDHPADQLVKDRQTVHLARDHPADHQTRDHQGNNQTDHYANDHHADHQTGHYVRDHQADHRRDYNERQVENDHRAENVSLNSSDLLDQDGDKQTDRLVSDNGGKDRSHQNQSDHPDREESNDLDDQRDRAINSSDSGQCSTKFDAAFQGISTDENKPR